MPKAFFTTLTVYWPDIPEHKIEPSLAGTEKFICDLVTAQCNVL